MSIRFFRTYYNNDKILELCQREFKYRKTPMEAVVDCYSLIAASKDHPKGTNVGVAIHVMQIIKNDKPLYRMLLTFDARNYLRIIQHKDMSLEMNWVSPDCLDVIKTRDYNVAIDFIYERMDKCLMKPTGLPYWNIGEDQTYKLTRI